MGVVMTSSCSSEFTTGLVAVVSKRGETGSKAEDWAKLFGSRDLWIPREEQWFQDVRNGQASEGWTEEPWGRRMIQGKELVTYGVLRHS